jgi:hypothetical protein
MKGFHLYPLSPVQTPLEGERARVRGNLISFPLPLILGAKLELIIFVVIS